MTPGLQGTLAVKMAFTLPPNSRMPVVVVLWKHHPVLMCHELISESSVRSLLRKLAIQGSIWVAEHRKIVF